MQPAELPGQSDWSEDLFRTCSAEPRNVVLLSHDELSQAMSRNTWRLFEHLQACGFDTEMGTRQRADDSNWARLADTVFFYQGGCRLELLNELSIHIRGTVLSMVSLFRTQGALVDGEPAPRDLLALSMHEPGTLDWASARFGVTHYRRSNLLAQLQALTVLESESCLSEQRLTEISQALEP